MARKKRKKAPAPVRHDDTDPTKAGDEADSHIKMYDRIAEKAESDSKIYQSIMQGGGEPFGKPYDLGVSSLTDKIVKLFSQRSWFGFETWEKTKRKRRNKFTRYGSSRYHGEYQLRKKKR